MSSGKRSGQTSASWMMQTYTASPPLSQSISCDGQATSYRCLILASQSRYSTPSFRLATCTWRPEKALQGHINSLNWEDTARHRSTWRNCLKEGATFQEDQLPQAAKLKQQQRKERFTTKQASPIPPPGTSHPCPHCNGVCGFRIGLRVIADDDDDDGVCVCVCVCVWTLEENSLLALLYSSTALCRTDRRCSDTQTVSL